MVSSSRLLATAIIWAVAVMDFKTDILSLPQEVKTRIYANALWDPAFGLGRQPREQGRHNFQGNRFDPHAAPRPAQREVYEEPQTSPTPAPLAIVEMIRLLAEPFWGGANTDATTAQDPAAEGPVETGRICRNDPEWGLRDVCYAEEL